MSTRALSHSSLIASVVLQLSKTFPFVVVKAFLHLKTDGEPHILHLFAAMPPFASALEIASRSPRHVTHRSRVSQGLSHLWTLSKATPIDVSRVGIEEADEFPPWVGKCGHWAAGRHLYPRTGV